MGTRVTFLGPPILQVGGEKFLTRNEVMRSLLGHLGRDRFHSFRGFKVPLVCGKGSTQRSCSTETSCTSTDTPCFFRKVTKAAVDSVRPTCTCTCTCRWTPPLAPPCAGGQLLLSGVAEYKTSLRYLFPHLYRLAELGQASK